MSGDIDEEGAAVLTTLDAVGNTTKAITKGIAIATAVLAATALFGSFTRRRHGRTQARSTPADARRHILSRSTACSTRASSTSPTRSNLVGLIIGAAVVFLFSGPRDQRGVPRRRRGRLRGAPPVPRASPGSWRAPSEAGVRQGRRHLHPRLAARARARRACSPSWRRSRSASGSASAPLGAYLAGAIATGTLMAVFLANSGGAWDNAKKLVEDGHLRRQGLRGARGHGHRRHRRRPVQGHRRPGDQPADQGDEPGRAADRPGVVTLHDRAGLQRRAAASSALVARSSSSARSSISQAAQRRRRRGRRRRPSRRTTRSRRRRSRRPSRCRYGADDAQDGEAHGLVGRPAGWPGELRHSALAAGG